MTRFEKCMQIVFLNEGGYVNDPNDSGGETKYGICKRSYPHLNIKELTKDMAEIIYKRDFYDKMKIDMFDNELLALHLFDFGINAGIGRAIKKLQIVAGITQDGIIGLQTITKANTRDLSLNYINARIEYYNLIGVGKNTRFLAGWMNRVKNTTKLAKS